MPRPLPALSLFALLGIPGLLGADRAPAADALQARGDRGVLILSQSSEGARVLSADGGVQTAPLPAGASLHSLQATAGGWTAAGTAPAAGGAQLLILSGNAAGTRALPVPATTGFVREPVLLAAGGRIAALAWIENEQVRSAERRATEWDAPRTVAGASAGMTMALAGSVLADGTRVLLWSAFDGEDDEIYWSARRGDGDWSAPVRLAPDNTVPDITPAVRSLPGGALAAWSRFDGNEYELVLSSFDGRVWSAPRRIAGAGALRPSFPDLPGAPLLLYRAARPLGWAVLAVNSGRISEVARSSDRRTDRPRVERQESGAKLLWDGSPDARSE